MTVAHLTDSVTGLPMVPAGTADSRGRGPAHVASPAEQPATLTQTSIEDLTTTRRRFSIPSGAKWVQVVFQDVGTTAVNGQFMRVVFGTQQDPLTAAEADGRLATPGAHIAVSYGVALPAAFSADNRCNTVDVIAAVAVGSGKNLVTIVAGV